MPDGYTVSAEIFGLSVCKRVETRSEMLTLIGTFTDNGLNCSVDPFWNVKE